MRKLAGLGLIVAAISLASVPPTHATTGPGCLVVVNVVSNDVLNIRSRASASAPIVGLLVPGNHGIIHLDGACIPRSVAWGSRWCPITHYNGDRTTKGWIKARFVRDSDCP